MNSSPTNVKAADRRDIALLTLFSFFVTGSGFLRTQSLYWDTGRLFTQFRDHLHSLNHFGEIAWWYPQNQFGLPAYFVSILNTAQNSSPVMAFVGFTAWLLGRLGVEINHFHAWYVFYFAAFVPFLFLLAINAFGRALGLPRSSRRLMLVIGAFSPGVMFNLTDVGFLEPLTYGTFYLAALIVWIRIPTAYHNRRLLFTLICLGISLNNAFVYWNILFLPVATALVLFSSPGQRKKARRAFGSLRPVKLIFSSVAIVIAALPSLATFWIQGSAVIQPALGGKRFYDFSDLAAGNPLEWLTMSLPGFGFDWRNRPNDFVLLPISETYHTAVTYLGMAALPLVVTGLIHGKINLRRPLWLLCLFAFGIVPLSASSPFLAPWLSLESPLLACNHWSDAGFKTGAFLILIVCAGVGWESLIRVAAARRTFFGVFVASSLVSVLTYLFFLDLSIFSNRHFGLFLVTCLLSFVLLFSAGQKTKEKRDTLNLFLLLIFFDVATHAFLYLRTIERSTYTLDSGWRAYAKITETPSETGIGMKESPHPHYYNNRYLMLRPLFTLWKNGIDPRELPTAGLFTLARKINSAKELTPYLAGPQKGILPITTDEVLLPLPNKISGTSSIHLIRQSYNQWDLEVSSPSPAYFFLKDGYSPFWKAEIDGVSSPVYRAFWNFKAVKISGGQHHVQLFFRPPLIPDLLVLAYLTLLFTGLSLRRWELPIYRSLKSATTGA